MAEPPAKKRKETPKGESTMEQPHENATNRSSRHTRNDLVTLLIGPNEEDLIALGHLLVRTSVFFQTALKKDWEEGRKRVIEMPEDDITLVSQYLDFIYGEGFRSQSIKELGDFAPRAGIYENLFELYTFGERMLDANLRNAIVEEVIRLLNLSGNYCYNPNSVCIDTIYTGTPVQSPARRLMVDLRIHYCQPDCSGELNSEYLADVVNELMMKRASEGGKRYYLCSDNLKADKYFV